MLFLELRLKYGDESIAKAIYDAVKPDNEGYVDSELNGREISFKMKSEDAGSLRNTADDLLACIKIAEETSGLVVPAADLDGDALPE